VSIADQTQDHAFGFSNVTSFTAMTSSGMLLPIDGFEKVLSSDIGAAIREARVATGLTLVGLARLAKLSQPHLSQIENGRASPSISSLYRIADALGIGPERLLPRQDDRGGIIVTRAGEGIVVPASDHPRASSSRLLIGGPGMTLEAHETSSSGNGGNEGWLQHDGDDFVYILEGSVSIEVKDGPIVHLGPGDSAWYRGRRAHRWELHPTGHRALLINTRGEAARRG
jgi:transcriptional regulator with XRE-family HTH domain